MLVLGSEIIDVPVMSLQTGTELARTKTPIVDPWTLKIVAYELDGPLLDTRPSLLRVADIREYSSIGMVVDSSDEFIGVDDVVKIKKVYDLNFSLNGMVVIDEQKRKLGKVIDYSIEVGGFVIQQLTVKRPAFKSLGDAELLIHRSQIVEVTDDTIIVRSGAHKITAVHTHGVNHYTNPFRSSSPQADSIEPKS